MCRAECDEEKHIWRIETRKRRGRPDAGRYAWRFGPYLVTGARRPGQWRGAPGVMAFAVLLVAIGIFGGATAIFATLTSQDDRDATADRKTDVSDRLSESNRETPPFAAAGHAFGTPTFLPPAPVASSTKRATVTTGKTLRRATAKPTAEKNVAGAQKTATHGNDKKEANDDATVKPETKLKPSPPPRPPAAQPKIDVAAHKSATPHVTLPADGSDAVITYVIAIVNNGRHVVTNVVASDEAPSGAIFTAVTQPPSQGSCSVAGKGASLSCSLGTLQPGQAVAFTATARVAMTGTITNVVTATGRGGADTDPANNTAKVQTLVVRKSR